MIKEDNLTIDQAMMYIKRRATACGYTDKMFIAFEDEIKDLLYKLEEWTVEDVDNLFDEVF